MGFGYLFLGYVVSLNFLVYSALTMPIAVVLMLRGMLSLSRFNRPLKEAYLLLWPTLLLSLCSFVLELLRMLSLLRQAQFDAINTPLSIMMPVALLLFTWRLLCGICALAKETGLPKLVYRARRNLVFSAIAYLAYIFFSLPIGADWFIAATVHAFVPVLLCRLIATVLNAMLIYSCYMWICMPEDLDMKRKKTGIGFLDELNEKMDKREEAAQEEKKKALADIYRKREEKYRARHKNDKGGTKS
ncbi:MAG: hypothetical protein J6D31_09835 [Clostridia bacterium]|nr:hypothetical protein [Clostridia bacterium]